MRIPAVNTAPVGSDTVIYMFYGDSTVNSPTENRPGVWDANFQGVWHLEEEVIDERPAGFMKTTSNRMDGVQWQNAPGTGRIAGGQDLDGTTGPPAADDQNGDRIDIPTPAIGNQVTVSAWVYNRTLPVNTINRFVNLGDEISIRHDGNVARYQLDFKVTSTVPTIHRVRVNNALAVNTWYHLVGTYDGQVLRVFRNGVQLDSLDLGVPTNLGPISGTSHIGASQTPTLEPMDGIIDEVRISDSARSACWIGGEYNNQFAPGDIGTPGSTRSGRS